MYRLLLKAKQEAIGALAIKGDSMIDLYNADCKEIAQMVLKENSIDTIITDPPYGLEFMGKGWDKGVPGG